MRPAWRIAVMAGGPSAEREVSLQSGAAVAKALRNAGHEVIEVDPMPGWCLPSSVQAVFLALHGAYGEDGTLQAELEERGVIYTGCGPEASRIAFDKILTKEKCVGRGLKTARYVVLREFAAPWPEGWAPPVVMKPAKQGSSVGLQFVEHLKDWEPCLREAFRFDDAVLVEEKIDGREVTVGILDGEVLPVVEVRPKSGAYDFANKYTDGATDYYCPARFDTATTARIQEAGLAAFEAIGGRDYARVDVIVTAQGEPVVLEVNTLPGMTPTSLLPKAAAAAGFSYEALCERMIELALGRKR